MLVQLLLLTVASAKVYLYGPADLKQRIEDEYRTEEIPSSLANFGNPPYNKVILGRVFVPDLDEHKQACNNLNPIDFNFDPDGINTPILLVQRGGCSFVVKVRNAQNIGASAVVIYDDREENVENVVMIDDGTAGNIFIPSFLIPKKAGELIHEELANTLGPHYVAMTLTFEMNRPDNRVEYELWLSSDHQLARQFLQEFAPMARLFDDESAKMTPNYVLWYCGTCSPEYTTDHPDCVSGGRYCAPDPDYWGPRTGREIVMEDLRQLCIYKQTRDEEDENIWWDYVEVFSKSCVDRDFNKECSEKAMKKVDIDPNQIDKCVRDSFDGPDEKLDDNWLLRAQRDKLLSSGVIFYPSIIINNQTFRGDLEAPEVMEAICAGFREKPEACFSHEEEDLRSRSGIGAGTLLLIIFFSMVLLAAILYFYRYWVRKEMSQEMRSQVNSAVSQYIALTEQSRD